jgi:hypothetical protein
MMPGEQDGWYRSVVPDLGPGIVGVLQHTVPVALIDEAFGIGEDPRHQTADGIRHRQGRDFPAGKDEVSKGDLLIHTFVEKALIHALVVSADQDQPVIGGGEVLGVLLFEDATRRGEVDGVNPPARLSADVIPTVVQRVCLHDSPLAPTVGVVVHLLLFISSVVSDLMTLNADEASLLGTAQDGFAEHVPYRVGEEGHDVNAIQRITSLQ